MKNRLIFVNCKGEEFEIDENIWEKTFGNIHRCSSCTLKDLFRLFDNFCHGEERKRGKLRKLRIGGGK